MTALQTLGFSDDEIFEVLDYLMSQKHYTSFGEVEKALEYIKRNRQLQEETYQRQMNFLIKITEVAETTV